jgi:hypothetical protein
VVAEQFRRIVRSLVPCSDEYHDIQLELHQYLPNSPANSRNRQEIIELGYPALIFFKNEWNLWVSVISE